MDRSARAADRCRRVTHPYDEPRRGNRHRVVVDSLGNPAIRAYAATTGRRLWTHAATPSGASPNGLPTIAAGVVYAATASVTPPGSYKRTRTAFRQSDGVALAAASVPGSSGAQVAPHVLVASNVVFMQTAGVLYGYVASAPGEAS